MKIELWWANQDYFVFPCNSGVIVSNQAGGMGCTHPEVEGLVVPLESQNTNQNDRHFCEWSWKSGYPSNAPNKKELIQKEIIAMGYEDMFEAAEPSEGEDWGEAWLPVLVKNDPKCKMGLDETLKNFAGKRGYLTYSNCD